MNYHESSLPRRIAGAVSSLALLAGFSGLGIAVQLNHPTGYLFSSSDSDTTSHQVFNAPGDSASSDSPAAPFDGDPSVQDETQQQPGDLEALPDSPQLPPEIQNDPALAKLFNQALESEQKGDLKAAATAYRKLLHTRPNLLPAHMNLAINLLQQEQPKQAIYHLKQAAKLAPDNPQVRAVLAQTYLQLKQPAEAYQQWVKVIEMKQPDQGQAAFNAGAIAFEQLKKPQDAERWLKLAHQQSKGEDPRVALMLGEVYAARGKHAQASKTLKPLAEQFPQIAEIQLALADAQWQNGAKDAALNTLRAAEKNVSPSENEGQNLAQVRLMLGRALAEQGKHAQAAVPLKAALKQLPKKSPAYEPTQTLLAQSYAAQAEAAEKSGNTQAALAAWKEVLTLFPDEAYASIQRGQLLEKQGNDRQALTEYLHALKHAPRDPALISTVAFLEEKTGEPARALSRWKSMVETKPDHEPAYFHLARLAAQQQQFAAQLDYLETRLNKQPDFRAAYDAILAAGQETGRAELARDWVSQMAKKHPKTAAPRNALTAFDREHPPQNPSSSPVQGTQNTQSTSDGKSTLGGKSTLDRNILGKSTSESKSTSGESASGLPQTRTAPPRRSKLPAVSESSPALQSAPIETPRSVITPPPPMPSLEKEE